MVFAWAFLYYYKIDFNIQIIFFHIPSSFLFLSPPKRINQLEGLYIIPKGHQMKKATLKRNVIVLIVPVEVKMSLHPIYHHRRLANNSSTTSNWINPKDPGPLIAIRPKEMKVIYRNNHAMIRALISVIRMQFQLFNRFIPKKCTVMPI